MLGMKIFSEEIKVQFLKNARYVSFHKINFCFYEVRNTLLNFKIF